MTAGWIAHTIINYSKSTTAKIRETLEASGTNMLARSDYSTSPGKLDHAVALVVQAKPFKSS